jgi:hypothetical protein
LIDIEKIEKKTYRSKREEIEEVWLIPALAIGIMENEFWQMNPHKINIRLKAYKEIQRRKDYDMWIQGLYTMKAFSVVISNAFGKHAEYFDEPISEKNRELTQEEIINQTKEFFAGLEIMKANFEAEKNR